MGVLPLQFRDGDSAETLGLTGAETFDITGLPAALSRQGRRTVTVRADGRAFTATVRIDTPREALYYRHGGIMRYVLRQLAYPHDPRFAAQSTIEE
jgi:aconitate hydratase